MKIEMRVDHIEHYPLRVRHLLVPIPQAGGANELSGSLSVYADEAMWEPGDIVLVEIKAKER